MCREIYFLNNASVLAAAFSSLVHMGIDRVMSGPCKPQVNLGDYVLHFIKTFKNPHSHVQVLDTICRSYQAL